MRILQLLHGDNFGGMEKFCIDLSNNLSKSQNEIYFMGSRHFKVYLNNKVYFSELDMEKSRNNIFFLFKIIKLIRKINPDIIHVHKQKSIQILNRIKPFILTPFIVTKHDTQVKKAFLGLKDAISISDEVSKTIKADNIYKIYNGIPYLEPKVINMPKDVFNIVAVGGLRQVKGYDKLIKACSQLSFTFHLTIIGEGIEKESLEKLSEKYSIKNNITFVGFRTNVNDYLFCSDLQVISSNSEGFSLAMIEGIFYAKVLISTPVSGCTEILSSKLLTEQDDLSLKINDVYSNYIEYKEEFKTIKKANKFFTIQNCGIEHLKTYLQIIKNR